MKPAVFLDKDGTLVEDRPYNVAPEKIRFVPGAARALKLLGLAGFRLVVVSNQPGVAHGFFPEDALGPVEMRLREFFNDAGAELSGFYFCPHHPSGIVAPYRAFCGCRKPREGMLVNAAGDLNIALDRSWMVGDILDDVEAGRRAGCRTVLVNNGYETEWKLSTPLRRPSFTARSLAEAANHILTSLGGAGRTLP
jgi:D-glycero-D-manno-heptose 1,7-bisphosphate phosphatase